MANPPIEAPEPPKPPKTTQPLSPRPWNHPLFAVVQTTTANNTSGKKENKQSPSSFPTLRYPVLDSHFYSQKLQCQKGLFQVAIGDL